MAQLRFGNESVIEGYKPDEGTNEVLYRPAKTSAAHQTMSLNETTSTTTPAVR
jgi:hypothetical protein